MAVTAEPTDEHAWQTRGGWHLLYGAMAVLSGLLIGFDPDASVPARLGRLALLAVLVAWYALAGVRALTTRDPRLGRWYVGVAVPLTVGLYTSTPIGALMFFLLYPHIWALLPTRGAVVASAAAATGIGVSASLSLGLGPRALVTSVGVGGASLAVAWLLGSWINRILDQSARRARLVAELDATRAQLAEASREAGMLAERQRLSRDIHDTVAQGLAAITLLLDLDADEIRADPDGAHRRIGHAREAAADNLAEARALVAALRPPGLCDAALPDAVGMALARARRDFAVRADLRITGEPRRLPVSGETAVLRAVQESLANTGRHAAATAVTVALDYRADEIGLLISDDGRGFDPVAAHGHGLPGMRDRFAELDGDLVVESRPGAGTTIRGRLPL